MARYNKGVNGSFKGLIGTAVGSKWKGKDVMRSRPQPSSKPPSEKQLMQQVKFSLIQRFISSLSSLLKFSFMQGTDNKTSMNSAFAHMYRNALSGLYPDYALTYSQVLVSLGGLLSVGGIQLSAQGNGVVKVLWNDNSGIANSNATDKSIIVVHCPEMGKSTYTVNGASRLTKEDIINVSVFEGKLVHVWLTFLSENGNDIASSAYAGEVVIS